MAKHIEFVKCLDGKDWKVQSKSGTHSLLGFIQWYPRWKRYIFTPVYETIYDAECLRDIANFCENIPGALLSGNGDSSC